MVGALLTPGVQGLLGVTAPGVVEGFGTDADVAPVGRGVPDREPALDLERLGEEGRGGREHRAPDPGFDPVTRHQEEPGAAQRLIQGTGQALPRWGALGPGGEEAEVETGQLAARHGGPGTYRSSAAAGQHTTRHTVHARNVGMTGCPVISAADRGGNPRTGPLGRAGTDGRLGRSSPAGSTSFCRSAAAEFMVNTT